MSDDQAAEIKPRKVGFLLGAGIFFLPFIFAWFTLRKGYGQVARIVSLGWMGLGVAFWVLASIGSLTQTQIAAGDIEAPTDYSAAEAPTEEAVASEEAPVEKTEAAALADGIYKAYSECNKTEDSKCLSIQEYEYLCRKINGITNNVVSSFNAGVLYSDQKFPALIKGGNIDSIKGQWRTDFEEKSGIKGACEVNIAVSGIYNGTSSRSYGSFFASWIIVRGSDILVDQGSPFATMVLNK